MGLEIGKRGLMSHQQALNVTGHNISNAENKEYSRQRVIITSAEPIYDPALNRANTPGQMGQGSVVSSVERIRDAFIDDRMISEKNTMGYWKTRSDLLYQVEKVYNEPSEQSLRTRLDELWKGWEELSKYPEERSSREVVKEKAVNLSNEVKDLYRQLFELRENVNNQVEIRVNEINTIARNIADLNERIQKAQALGDNPNDLMDRRDALVEKLATQVNVSVGRSDKDELIIYIGSEHLVQGSFVRPLQALKDPDNNGYARVVWKDSGSDVPVKNGELYALLEVRDRVLRENINSMNAFAINLADMTNEIHRDGFTRRGETNIDFFRMMSQSDNVEGNVDLNGDGVEESTAIFRVSGNNRVDASAAIGIRGTLTFISNDGTEQPLLVDYNEKDTVNTIIKRINDSSLGVVAYLNHDNEFSLKATISNDVDKKNFIIRHLEDSGQFMVGLTGVLKQSGAEGAFDYRRVNDIARFLPSREHVTLTPRFNPASYMAVSERVLRDVDSIAAAKGKDVGGTGDYNTTNGIGDGNNALLIAAMRNKNAMVDNNSGFNDFYVSLVARVGTQGEEAKDRVQNQDTLLKNLSNLRESVSGINMDEEMAGMVAFQHGYNAAARLISVVDRMLETIIKLGA